MSIPTVNCHSIKRLVVSGACLTFLSAAVAAQAPADLASRSVGAWGVDLTDQDHSVRPGDNFYMYQNGAWFARTELGPQLKMAAYWRDLRLLAPQQLVAILEGISKGDSKVAAFYRAFMDEKAVEAKGVAALQPELDAIRAAGTQSAMAELMGRAEGPGLVRPAPGSSPPIGRGMFIVSIGQDLKAPSHYAVYIDRGGLLLPSSEYYLDPRHADVLAAYTKYVARMLTLVHWPDPEMWAQQVVAFERDVAAVRWSPEQGQELTQSYNRVTAAELINLAPGFDWSAYLRGAGVGTARPLVIDSRIVFPAIAAVFAKAPLEVLQARDAFAIADASATFLSTDFVTTAFEFRSTTMGNGSFMGAARSLRAEKAAELSLSDAVAALYVAQYSSPEVKARADEMAGYLRQALDARLSRLAWLSPVGKRKAREKLAAMKVNIGYPDTFDDYQGLEIRDDDLYGNVQRAAAWAWQKQIDRLDRPFDRSQWVLSPQYPQYNYTSSTNTVEIPSALLVPPFFDLHADEAVNYGAVGAVIGAEMYLAFTSQGLPYNGAGRLEDWMPADDTARHGAMSARIAAQYSTVEPLPGLHLKGDQLQSESVSDLGGMLIALDAYHLSLKGKQAPVLDGYTGDQRFFLGRAQMWRAKFGTAFVRNQIVTASNSPPFMRVNGPLPNMDAWYEAFGVQPGDRMYVAPDQRVRIW